MKSDMNDSELLVQRFVDQELGAEERIRFVARLGRDEALRERLIELEQLALDVSRLPKPAVPADFVARVMERTPRRPSVPLSRAALALAACLALLVAGGILRGIVAPTPGPATPATASNSAPPPVLVRLMVLQPMAKTVQVAGDFNGWNPMSTPLEPISNGAWTVTIPLNPGRYEYMFVVDGQQWVGDPFATEHNDDGFGAENAVLDVRPPAGAQS
jgi:hypothetical protein